MSTPKKLAILRFSWPPISPRPLPARPFTSTAATTSWASRCYIPSEARDPYNYPAFKVERYVARQNLHHLYPRRSRYRRRRGLLRLPADAGRQISGSGRNSVCAERALAGRYDGQEHHGFFLKSRTNVRDPYQIKNRSGRALT